MTDNEPKRAKQDTIGRKALWKVLNSIRLDTQTNEAFSDRYHRKYLAGWNDGARITIDKIKEAVDGILCERSE